MNNELANLSEWWLNYKETQEEKDCYKEASDYEDAQKFEEAINTLNKGLEKFPNNVNLLNKRAIQYQFIRDFEKGLIDVNKAIALEADAACFNTRALIYEGLEQYEKALLDHNEAVKQAPDWFQCRFDRAVFFWGPQNDNIKALEEINEAIRIKPEALEAYLFRAEIYTAQKEYNKAINDYEHVINNSDDKKSIIDCKNKIKELNKVMQIDDIKRKRTIK